MVTIQNEFALAAAVTVNGIAGVIKKIHNGPWLSQPRQNRFYVLYNTPVGGLIGDWYAASQGMPVGASATGTFDASFDIGETVIAVSPTDELINTTCVGLHYGPMNTATIEVTYMLIYDTPQTFGTGRWYTLDELTG